MKLTFSTLGCPGWTFNEVFATAKDLGMQAIEIRGIRNQMYAPDIPEFVGKQLPVTLQRLQDANLQISMLTSGAVLGYAEDNDRVLDECKDYIDTARDLHAPYVRILMDATVSPQRPVDLQLGAQRYGQLCDYAKDKNVCVLLETNGVFADTAVAAKFISQFDPQVSGLLWDIHHPFRFFHETPAQTLANIAPYVKYLHVKDSVMLDGQLQYRMMGYGDIPILDSLRLLKQQGYDGFISLEWVKRWNPDLQEPGIVFAHFMNYMSYLINQL